MREGRRTTLAPVTAALLAASTTTHASPELEDVGGLGPACTTRALLVVSPGLAPRATDALVDAVEAAGVDVWRLTFPVDQQSPAAMHAAITDGLAALGPGPVGLIGHGLGGTLAVQSAASGAGAAAVAVVGAPLRSAHGRLVAWLGSRPLPPLGIDPDHPEAQTAAWNGQPVLPLLLGEPLPPMLPVSASWLEELQRWAQPGWRSDAAEVQVPLWAAVGVLDNLAPPESVRMVLPPGAVFERYGLGHLDDTNPTHIDLLRSHVVGTDLGTWMHARLQAAGAVDADQVP